MRPYPFQYFAAEDVQHAAELLSEHGQEARILAGGQTLVPLLLNHLARPEVLISVSRAGLEYIQIDHGTLSLGAATRDRVIERSQEVASVLPILVRATRHIGHPNIRNKGTIGGSLAHNDPAAEYPAVLLTLGAAVTLRSATGTRTMEVADLIEGRILETAMRPEEVLESIHIPLGSAAVHYGFAEQSPRHGDYAIAGVISSVEVRDHAITSAVIGVFGGSKTTRLSVAEETLIGTTIDSNFVAFEETVRETFPTFSDMNASSDYRSHLAGVMAKRAVRDSLAAA